MSRCPKPEHWPGSQEDWEARLQAMEDFASEMSYRKYRNILHPSDTTRFHDETFGGSLEGKKNVHSDSVEFDYDASDEE